MPEDWIEAKECELLAKAKASRWFKEIIDDAKWFAKDGYAWDVALAIACQYWL